MNIVRPLSWGLGIRKAEQLVDHLNFYFYYVLFELLMNIMRPLSRGLGIRKVGQLMEHLNFLSIMYFWNSS